MKVLSVRFYKPTKKYKRIEFAVGRQNQILSSKRKIYLQSAGYKKGFCVDYVSSVHPWTQDVNRKVEGGRRILFENCHT